jgi:hypothetical protein
MAVHLATASRTGEDLHARVVLGVDSLVVTIHAYLY